MIRSDMAIRLTEERARLGYSQADFANKTSISREGLRLYETGQRGIAAEFLVIAAELGVDVQYVLLGVRSSNVGDIKQAYSHTITGNVTNSVITGTGSTVNQINTNKHITKTIAKVTPNEEHISEKMAAILTKLVNEIVETEAKQKKTPKSHKAVWSSLNRYCQVTSYRLIALEDYSKAEKYLQTWLGRLSSMKSAPKVNSQWRNRKYAYIKINTKDQGDWLDKLLIQKYSVNSITELNDEDLEKVYRSVASKKRMR